MTNDPVTDNPVVLTAEMAERLLEAPIYKAETRALQAIRDKRTVCVPVRTEAEERERFTKMFGVSWDFNPRLWEGWLAAKRDAGVLPTGEKVVVCDECGAIANDHHRPYCTQKGEAQ